MVDQHDKNLDVMAISWLQIPKQSGTEWLITQSSWELLLPTHPMKHPWKPLFRRFCDQNPIHFLGGPIQSIFGQNHNLVISCPESMASTAPLLSTARKSCDRNVSMGTWADEWKSRICVNMYIQHRNNMCIYAYLCKSIYVCTCM